MTRFSNRKAFQTAFLL